MGKQAGPLRLIGTHTDLTLYAMNGEFLFRKKSSLDKHRVKTDPAFENSRRASAAFGAASTVAKKAYWQLPGEKRKHRVFGKVTAMARKLLKEGVEEAEAIRQIMRSI